MTEPNTILPNLFRTEYGNLVAVLCKRFGLSNIQLAEDIVSDTFLLAMETWGKKGIPDNQIGWLHRVANNRTKDFLRRKKIRIEKVEPYLFRQEGKSDDQDLDLSSENISDSTLRMLFAICHPMLKKESQVVLALRILAGLGIEEIASALLTNKETINKRLYRAKASLRKSRISIDFPPEKELPNRLDSVLTTLYLVFNEGYYAMSHEEPLRADLSLEAMRLVLLLTENPNTNLPPVNALMALMCFHASRFGARTTDRSQLVLYRDQDRTKWDRQLMEKGSYYLNKSSRGDRLTKYHLEAAIAYWHTQPDNREKWENILQLYNYLLQIAYSPMAALNRTYALARAGGKKAGLTEALKLQLDHHHLYHALLAELFDTDHLEKKRFHLSRALELSKSASERILLAKKLEELEP